MRSLSPGDGRLFRTAIHYHLAIYRPTFPSLFSRLAEADAGTSIPVDEFDSAFSNARRIASPFAVVNEVTSSATCALRTVLLPRRSAPSEERSTRAQISARQASLRSAPSRGSCFLKLKQSAAGSQPASKRPPELLGRRHPRCHCPMAAVSVHTTQDCSSVARFTL
jgi:hypothetical protein